MTDHSPGPWTFDGPIDNIHVRQAADPDMRVCFMTSNGHARQNAALIAAAPDLLAAAEAMEKAEEARANCEGCDGEEIPELCGTCFPLFYNARVARRLAIAKASLTSR